MKKIYMFSALVMLTILASCGTNTDSDSISFIEVETSTPSQEFQSSSVDEPVVLAQGFVEYDSSYIGETQDTVLFFHAEWCGSCKTAEADIIENGVPSDLTVLKVDFDAPENLELRQKYGVTTKHTFVQVDANGNLLNKWEGSTGIDDIREKIAGEDVMMKKEDTMQKEDVMMQKQEPVESQEVMTKELAGVYANYDSSLVGSTDDTVIFFHAAWCPSCTAADKGISAGIVPESLTILKADFDSETELRKQYGVTGQHTFVQVDADGNEIKKWVGGNSVEDIVERVQ